MNYEKNAGDKNFSRRDGFQTLKEAFRDDQSAFDYIAANSLIPDRYTKITWDFITLGDGTDDIDYIYFWGYGKAESNQIEIAGTPLGSKEKTTLNFAEVVNSFLSGSYFFIYDDAGSVCVWFNDGDDSQPSVVANRFLEVGFDLSDTPSELANKTQVVLHADSEFTAVSNSTYVMASSISNGIKPNAVDGGSGVQISITDGTDNINSKYIYIYDSEDNKYHVWWNVNSTGSDPDPDPGNSTPIEVALDVAETASTVAEKSSIEINNLEYFISTSENEFLIIKNAREGASLGVVDGNTTYVIDNIIKGEDKPLVKKLKVFYDANYCPASVEVVEHA